MADVTMKAIAGPLEFDRQVVERDAAIRENNHGKRIDDSAVRQYVEQNKSKIFSVQAEFFAELRDRLARNS